ncbi:MAG: SagB/ThcOx family dehydrogenase [Halobacteriota archaeon]
MQVELAQLRRTMSETYAPTRTTLLDSYFSRFTERSFRPDDIAALYHENSKYTDHDGLELGESAALFTDDPSIEYAQAAMTPDYADTPAVELPEPAPLSASIDDVLSRRRSRRSHSRRGISRADVGTLLGHALGVTTERSIAPAADPFSAVTKRFRAYASGGALYPVEFYLAIGSAGTGLDPGLYYYVPETHSLRVLDRVDADAAYDDTVDDCFATPESVFDHTSTSITMFMTGAFPRTKAKYGPRGYRFVLQEAGHASQNLLLVAEAMGLAALPLASFYDDRVNDLLGIDGVNEAVIASMSIGHRPESDDSRGN